MSRLVQELSAKSKAVTERWSKQIDTVNKARVSAGLQGMDEWKATAVANILETFDMRSKLAAERFNIGAANEATQPADVSFIRRHGINILTAAVPNFIAHD